MSLLIRSQLLIRICLVLANISFCTYCRTSSAAWPWNLFRKKIDHYDKDVERKANLTTDGWIRKLNFPCNIHKITTDDGYILTLQRIPKPGHQPALLVHGLLTSSLSFVMMGAENGLAFQLSSSDFDVWLLNTRGSVYSQNHTTLLRNDPLFWKFSFHEIGLYDLSAAIDFVRNTTSFHQIVFIGHSQGATALLALCSARPEYNDRVLLMHALAPIVHLRNVTQVSTDKADQEEKTKSKSFEIFSQGDLLRSCSIRSEQSKECVQLMRNILGVGQYNQSLDPIVLGTALAGGSLQEIEHYLQILKSGDFAAFDHGLEGNKQIYGRPDPDAYNLTKVTLPVILHYGRTDAVASPEAVHNLHKTLPGLVGLYVVQSAKFNHFDFIWAPAVGKLVNANIIKLCDEFRRGVLKYIIE